MIWILIGIVGLLFLPYTLILIHSAAVRILDAIRDRSERPLTQAEAAKARRLAEVSYHRAAPYIAADDWDEDKDDTIEIPRP